MEYLEVTKFLELPFGGTDNDRILKIESYFYLIVLFLILLLEFGAIPQSRYAFSIDLILFQ
jgi:hypothetical protein